MSGYFRFPYHNPHVSFISIRLSICDQTSSYNRYSVDFLSSINFIHRVPLYSLFVKFRGFGTGSPLLGVHPKICSRR